MTSPPRATGFRAASASAATCSSATKVLRRYSAAAPDQRAIERAARPRSDDFRRMYLQLFIGRRWFERRKRWRCGHFLRRFEVRFGGELGNSRRGDRECRKLRSGSQCHRRFDVQLGRKSGDRRHGSVGWCADGWPRRRRRGNSVNGWRFGLWAVAVGLSALRNGWARKQLQFGKELQARGRRFVRLRQWVLPVHLLDLPRGLWWASVQRRRGLATRLLLPNQVGAAAEHPLHVHTVRRMRSKEIDEHGLQLGRALTGVAGCCTRSVAGRMNQARMRRSRSPNPSSSLAPRSRVRP